MSWLKRLPLRFMRPSPKNTLTITFVICFILLLVTLLFDNTSLPAPGSRMINAHARDLKTFSSKRAETKTFRSWRKRQTKWPTTARVFPTTDVPFAQSKYYTYIEDFLANWNQYPMTESELKRVDDVHAAAIRLKNRRLFTEALTDPQRSAIYDLLSSFHTLAKKEGIRYFIYGGTLLGSFRHHDIIPYDDDVDIIIHGDDRKKLRQAVQKSSQQRFAMSTLSPDHYKLHSRSGTFTNLYYDWTYPYLDISFYKVNETHLYDLAMTYGRWWAYRRDVIFPLHDRPLGSLMLPAPRDTYKYLLTTYSDLSHCSESFYSHQLEMVIRCRMVFTDCEKLPYAFVHRSLPSSGKGVNESLVLDGEVLSWKVVDEPDYQAYIGNPYTLRNSTKREH